MHVLVTGGAGYIGSHTCLHLLQSGTDVTVIDNFCNSWPEAMNRVQALSGRSLHVVQGDVRNAALSTRVRKYIDVIALTARHEEALAHLRMHADQALSSMHLGTEQSRSEEEVINIFSVTSGRPIPDQLVAC